MRSKPAIVFGLPLAALLLLAGCQDQQTPGEDPVDVPMSEPGEQDAAPQAQHAPQSQGGAAAGLEAGAEQGQAPPTQNDAGAEEQVGQAANGATDEASPQRLFEQHCSVCHTLDLPRSQRLNRTIWREVVDDMVDFGMTWLSEEEQELIVEYLAENYGPDSPR